MFLRISNKFQFKLNDSAFAKALKIANVLSCLTISIKDNVPLPSMEPNNTFGLKMFNAFIDKHMIIQNCSFIKKQLY